MLVESAKVKLTRKKMGFLQFLKHLFQPFSSLLCFSSFSHSLWFPLGCNGRSSQDSKLEPHHQQKTDFLDFAATSTSKILLQNIFKICSFTFYLAHFFSFLGLQILGTSCERRYLLSVREDHGFYLWSDQHICLWNSFLRNLFLLISKLQTPLFPGEWKNVHTKFLISEQNQNQLLPVQGGNWKCRVFHIDESIILWL